jgi:hypothetical protein
VLLAAVQDQHDGEGVGTRRDDAQVWVQGHPVTVTSATVDHLCGAAQTSVWWKFWNERLAVGPRWPW